MERIQQFLNELKKDKIVKKNLYPYSWLSGSSTEVMPITVIPKEIILQ